MTSRYEYLRLAADADRLAAQETDALLRSSWTCIARSYRELARMKEAQSPSAMPSRRGSAAPT